MRIDYSELHIVFITETDDVARTDEKYIRKFLKVHYPEYFELIHPMFINTSGNTNMIKQDVVTEVARKRSEIFGHPYFKVVQCFDRDRNRKDKTKVENIIEFASTNGYEPVIFSKNVEDVFKPGSGGSKKEKAQQYYSKTLSKTDLPIEIFRHDLDECRKKSGISNLDLVLKPIINKIKK